MQVLLFSIPEKLYSMELTAKIIAGENGMRKGQYKCITMHHRKRLIKCAHSMQKEIYSNISNLKSFATDVLNVALSDKTSATDYFGLCQMLNIYFSEN